MKKTLFILLFISMFLHSQALAIENVNSDSETQLQRIKEIQESIKIAPEINLTEENNITVEGSIEKTQTMSVDDCIRLALEHNPAIMSAISNKDIYKTKIGQAWSAYFPRFSTDFNYSRNAMLFTNFKAPSKKYNMYYTPTVSVNQLIYDFGKTRAATNIAKKSFEAADDNLQAAINNTVYNVKEAYYNLLYAIQQEKVYTETVINYETHLKQAQSYYSIGNKAKIDVITAEYNLGSAKLNLIKAKHQVDLAYAQLNNAMGLPEHINYTINDKFDIPQYNLNAETLINKSYELRPELLAAQKQAEGSKILISASKFAFLPDLAAFGSYSTGGKTPFNDYGYQLGAGLQYQTTNLYLLKKQVDEAKATHKKDLADYEKIKQDVYLDVKSAYIQYNNANESIPVAKLSMLNAKEQYDLASGRYKAGLGDAIELKDAEITYRNAQLDYYNSLLNYNISIANLEKVVGIPLADLSEKL